ncbi:Ger(x)C family spore germination protein [Neobacillus niacini]|uniref:Ger(x)C family spore germination protein n=1 Tax=Neobacillus niacini TaxID=86668 RepID=UPI003B018058
MNQNVILFRALISIFLLALFVTGCGFKDIDKRLFVVSVGIDPAKNSSKKFLVSLKFAVPNIEKVSNESFIISQEGDTIAEAVRMMKSKVDKEIDFSHAKLVVYNEEVINSKLDPNLYYWFIRRRDFQEMSWVAVGKPTAKAVLKLKPKSERLPSNALFLALGKDGTETAYIIPEFLFDFKKRFGEKGLDPLLPIIQAKEDTFEINTVALLDKNKLKLKLPSRETMFLNLLLTENTKTALKINDGEDSFVIDTQSVKTKYKIITENQKQPYIEVDMSIDGRIEEARFNVSNKDLDKYEKAAKNHISKKVKVLLEKMQKANVDPLGFGLRYRSRQMGDDDWKTWQQLYPAIKFKVNADINISDTGLVE